jgi:hypothetical protein
MRDLQGGHVIIVSGRIDLQPGARQKFLKSAVEAVGRHKMRSVAMMLLWQPTGLSLTG